LRHWPGVFVEILNHSQACSERIKADAAGGLERGEKLQNFRWRGRLIERPEDVQPIEQDTAAAREASPVALALLETTPEGSGSAESVIVNAAMVYGLPFSWRVKSSFERPFTGPWPLRTVTSERCCDAEVPARPPKRRGKTARAT
jgi:hypothetical protein